MLRVLEADANFPLAPLGRIVIYTRHIPQICAFYAAHFGFQVIGRDGDRIAKLQPIEGGAAILLHPAGKGQRQGQVLVKLVFDVADVVEFCHVAATKRLVFGPIHQAKGYAFANARDPSGNPISVSSRAYAQPDNAQI